MGKMQWEFDKTRILHKFLDCIAVNMPKGRCLNYRSNPKLNQDFWQRNKNLRKLKVMVSKVGDYLMMVIVLDKAHMNYCKGLQEHF